MTVQITKEVEKAFNVLLEDYKSEAMVFNIISSVSIMFETSGAKTARSWYKEQNDDGRNLMKVLLGDYEVLADPKDKFNERYDLYKNTTNSFDKGFWYGMIWTAKLFNLDVKGVDEL